MARARYQVLVIPYCIEGGSPRFCLFRRSDMGIWQFIAGGGEDEDISIIESAKREAFEEAGISKMCDFLKLDTCCSIPSNCFKNAEALWGKECFVIPEYAFAVRSKVLLCGSPMSIRSAVGCLMRRPERRFNTTATRRLCGS